MWAACHGKLDCLEFLIAKGAKLDVTSNVSAALPADPHPPPPLALRLQAPPARPPPPLTRVCAAAPASRQYGNTALHLAAYWGRAPCVEALLKAGADARLKTKVRDGAEGRGGRRKGAWGGGALRRRRAAPPRRPQPPPSPSAAAATTFTPSPRFPVGRMATRRWTTPRRRGTRRSSRSWRTPPPSQRRSARVRTCSHMAALWL